MSTVDANSVCLEYCGVELRASANIDARLTRVARSPYSMLTAILAARLDELLRRRSNVAVPAASRSPARFHTLM